MIRQIYRVHLFLIWLTLLSVCVQPVLSADQRSVVLLSAEAKSYFSRGDHRRALENYSRALRGNPNHLPAMLGLSEVYNAIGSHTKAKEILTRALKLGIDVHAVNSHLGDTSLHLGDINKAMEYYQNALRIRDGYIPAELGIVRIFRFRGQYSLALSRINRLERRDSENMAIFIEKFHIGMASKNFSLAQKSLARARAVDPNYAGIYAFQGMLLLQRYLSQPQELANTALLNEALEDLNRSLELGMENADLLFVLNQIYFSLGKWQEAAATLGKIRRLRPDDSFTYYLSGMAAQGLGKKEEALSFFQVSLRRNSNNSVFRNHLENFLKDEGIPVNHPLRRQLAMDRYRNAIYFYRRNLADSAYHELQRALMLDPDLLVAREKVLEHYQHQNAFPLYLQELKKIISIIPAEKSQMRDRYQFLLEKSVRQRRSKLYYQEGVEYPFDRTVYKLGLRVKATQLLTRKHPNVAQVFAKLLQFDLSLSGRFAFREGHDFVLMADIQEISERIRAEVVLKQALTGIVLHRFAVEESGRGALDRVSIRVAKRINESMPMIGKIIKMDPDYVLVSLGRIDGLDEKTPVYFFSMSQDQFLSEKNRYPKEAQYKGTIVKLDDFVAKIVLANQVPTIHLNSNDLAVIGLPPDPEDKKKRD